jgi:hypothetical protein
MLDLDARRMRQPKMPSEKFASTAKVIDAPDPADLIAERARGLGLHAGSLRQNAVAYFAEDCRNAACERI